MIVHESEYKVILIYFLNNICFYSQYLSTLIIKKYFWWLNKINIRFNDLFFGNGQIWLVTT